MVQWRCDCESSLLHEIRDYVRVDWQMMASVAGGINVMMSFVYKQLQHSKSVHPGILVKILGAMHILMSSWNKSLQAYGISTRQMSCDKDVKHIHMTRCPR
jgi:hypothetical protein